MSMRPLPSMILSRRTKIALSVVAIVIVVLIVLVKLSGVYINYLWYGSLDARQVYTTMLWTKVSLFFIFGVLMALIIGGNLVIAYLLRPPFRPMSAEQQNLQNYVLMIEPRRKLILAGVMIIALLAEGASAQGDWAKWQLWLHGTSFGIKDPQFHRDISFYAWDYPVYRALLGFGFTAILFSLVLCIGVHYLTGAIRLQTPGPKVTLTARRHLTVLVFVFMALKAIAYWLDRYGLVFSTRSKFTGASYTDVHSALPAKTILFWIAIVLALGVLASVWLRSVLLPGIGFAVLLVLSILISGIYPAIVQQVSVKPNASDKERVYISRNIEATRAAYGIVTKDAGDPKGSVVYDQYEAIRNPNPSDADDTTNPTVDNIRILDPNVISPTFRNFQKIGIPYGFSPTLDVDRYTLENSVTHTDETHDYVVGVREQVPGSNLIGSQDNWINQHTVYTHGYGFVAARADTSVTSTDEALAFTEGSIPPAGPLTIDQPDVYYGQLMNNYSIVGASGEKREYDANGGAYVSYQGSGGVSLGNFFTRLAFTVNWKDTNFLLNGAASASGAKVIFNRDPKTMVEKVAPFLTVDGDPYPVVANGRITWILDGYTTMANYPYSERQSLSDLTHTSLQQGQKDTQINYIRNSVKATVDAYDGTVTLYAWEPDDPVLKSWMNIYPGLVKSADDMPDSIRQHIRYPQDLFDVQRGLLAQYHITDPVQAYNGTGKWQVPDDPFASRGIPQPPYYILAAPPGAPATSAAEFQLTSPMVVPGGTNNLAAYMSVNSDYGPDYGTITVLEVPTENNIDGPSQIGNIFTSEPVISKDISLLGGGQSSVLHGNLLTLPVGDSFLYVEPLYVQGTGGTSSFPTLQRVLVTYGTNKGYAETLDKALADLQTPGDVGASIDTTGGTVPPPSPVPTGSSSSGSGSSSPPPPNATIDQLLAQLATAQANLNAAYDTHDPGKIADAQAARDAIVARLIDAQPTPSPTPGPTK
ncbi:MAG: uncharacterized protein QOJ34_505 [Pseudonocardiales bacterium]|nr:uncharacterized protein [Pseudonocardiales bacterium]